MNEADNNIIIRSRKRTVIGHILIGLVLIMFSAPAIPNIVTNPTSVEPETFLFSTFLLLLGVWLLCNGIYLHVWKCTIKGDTITFQSLFRRKTTTFSDINRIAPKRWAHASARHGIDGNFVGIDIFPKTGKRFHIHGSKTGFRAFITHLETHNIPGTETLPKGIHWQ